MIPSQIALSRFRRILPQLFAAFVENLLIVDMGLICTLPVVLIAAMSGIPNEHNRNEYLSLNPNEASWLGSIGYLLQPIGCVLSVFIIDPLGRKRSLIFVNIPLACGWFMIYQGDAIWKIFTGYALQGLGIGLMEGPIVTYLGEICEPSVRGALVSLLFISSTFGEFLGLLLNTLMPWRSIAQICLTLPIISAVAISFIPETPQWLLSKNRADDAEKSLCWLRGWVSREVVAQEFQELQQQSLHSKSCNICIKENISCTHPLPTLSEKFGELRRKRTLKPLVITTFLFAVAQFSGVYSMRACIVQLFKAYDTPLPSDHTVAILSLLETLSCAFFMSLIHFTGKRPIYLVTSFGIFLCAAIISCYGFIYLPSGYVSFNLNAEQFHVENAVACYIPTVFLILWSIFSNSGFLMLPWILLSEIFPFKSRGIVSGISAALNYILGFISRKIYYNMEMSLSLPGVSLFFCVICGLAFIVAFFILPETENRTLEDIERHFSDNSKKITDLNIVKSNEKTQTNDIN